MTVEDLIEILEKYPSKLRIYLQCGADNDPFYNPKDFLQDIDDKSLTIIAYD